MGIGRHVSRVVRRYDDAGVSLVEVLVAIGLLLILSMSIAGGLLAIQKSAFTSKKRSAAADLAAREVEIVRNQFHASDTAPAAVMTQGDTINANPLGATGPTGPSGPLTVDNVPYTVKHWVSWNITGNGVSACDGGSVVSYPSVALHVEVTWPNMGAVPPITSDTVMTPPKSVLNTSSSYLAVKVLDRDGAPSEGRAVNVTGPGGASADTTGPDGCATFVLSAAGSYTVSLNETGYVAYNGTTTASVPVTAGNLTTKVFNYDLGETFRATLRPPSGYNLPTTLPAVSFGNSGIQPTGIASYVSTVGGTTVVGPVWPFSSGYSVWAGSCAASDPGAGGTRPAAVIPAKGSTTNVDAALQGLAITTTYKGTPVSVPVTAVAGDGVTPVTCPSGDQNLTLGTSAGGALNSSIPYGTWTLRATINSQLVSGTITVGASSPVAVTLNGTV